MAGSSGSAGGRNREQRTRRRSMPRWLIAIFLTLRGRLILLVCFATVPAILFIFFVAVREREAALARMETEARPPEQMPVTGQRQSESRE